MIGDILGIVILLIIMYIAWVIVKAMSKPIPKVEITQQLLDELEAENYVDEDLNKLKVKVV